MLCIATSWENRDEVLALAAAHSEISAAVGVHPTTTGGHEPTLEELTEAVAADNVVAVGETGLDYFRSEGDLRWQHKRFHRHIEAARSVKKPLIIHTRAAADDTMQTLRDHSARDAGGVMHCFAEDWEVAEQALEKPMPPTWPRFRIAAKPMNPPMFDTRLSLSQSCVASHSMKWRRRQRRISIDCFRVWLPAKEHIRLQHPFLTNHITPARNNQYKSSL